MSKQLSQDFVGTSLSWGTMRDVDLYESFMPFLHEHAPDEWRAICTEYSDVIAGLDAEGNQVGAEYVEGAEYLIEALFDAINEIAPEGTYFGAHEGDGSDYGFWSYEDEDDEE